MEKYTILKGWHYACFLFGRLCGWHYDEDLFLIDFKFDNNCWWETPRNDDDYDLNKLYGISFGLFAVHKDSVRFAWRPDFEKKDEIQIYGYTYDSNIDGHTSQYITNVKLNQVNKASIDIWDDVYYLEVNDVKIKMNNPTKDRKVQKELYPYFGGNNRAPQTMNIFVKLFK